MKNNFCILPFIHLSTRTNGAMQLCCHANSGSGPDYRKIGCNRKDTGELVYVDQDKPSEYWNTEYYKNIRKKFLEGRAPKECRACFKEEASGYRSKRQWENEEWAEKLSFDEVLERVESDGTAPFDIKYVDMKLGNKCDLACLMCNPGDSSLWIPDYKKLMESDISDESKKVLEWNKTDGKLNWYKSDSVFWEDIKSRLDTIKNFYIIGGEPTINKEFKSFLEMCVKSGYSDHINLRFNTNGLTVSKELTELYSRFKTCLIHLSLDGIAEHYNLIRYPSKWEVMQEKLEEWDNTPDNIKVTIDATVSILNVMHIDELIRWKVLKRFKKINAFPTNNGLIGMHFLHSPNFLNITVLPAELKKQVKNKIFYLKNWIDVLGGEGYAKLDALVNFMNSQDNSDRWPQTVKYLDNMDKIRNTNWRSVLTEYEDY
jgi:hypothetical protein